MASVGHRKLFRGVALTQKIMQSNITELEVKQQKSGGIEAKIFRGFGILVYNYHSVNRDTR